MSVIKRMHFFKGLFTTADDWKAEQQYHIAKRKLHSRCLHTPGVVPGEGDELRVIATDQGGIIVQPGYAIDGHGQDLYLLEPKEISIRPDTSGPDIEAEVYVFIAFGEEKIDVRESHLSPDLTDHAFVEENPTIGWTNQVPDNKDKIELARIKWRAGRRIIADHIDLGHVRYAGASGAMSHVKSDDIILNPSPPEAGMQFALGDVRVHIQTYKDLSTASGIVYTANVFPVEIMGATTQETRLMWRVESSMNPAHDLAYHLVLKNVGTVKVKAWYEIYRLNLGKHQWPRAG